MWYGAPSAVLTLRSTLSPALMLVLVAKPSSPVGGWAAPCIFHVVVPGNVFSLAIALPPPPWDIGAAVTTFELADWPLPVIARTA